MKVGVECMVSIHVLMCLKEELTLATDKQPCNIVI